MARIDALGRPLAGFVSLDRRPIPRGYLRLTIGGVRHYARAAGQWCACGRPRSWEDGTAARVACQTCNLASDRSRRSSRAIAR